MSHGQEISIISKGLFFNCQCAYVDVLDGFGCQLDQVLFQQENGFWLTATFQATTLRLVHVNTGITFDFRKLLN